MPVTFGKAPQYMRRSIRLQGYDYSQSGMYFVTICAYQKSCMFGHIRDGSMEVNALGLIVEDCWRQIAQVRSNVELDDFIVMPNHVHGIIAIINEETTGFCNGKAQRAKAPKGKLSSGSLGVIVGQFKRAVTIHHKLLHRRVEHHIWQRNIYEHIIRNENSLNEILQYIVANPAKWQDDSLYVE